MAVSWPLRKSASCLPLAHLLASWGTKGSLASSSWASSAFLGKGKSSLPARALGELLCALFCWLWAGSFFFYLMALHKNYSIKFCILLQGPTEPNPKSAERVWSCLGLSPHTGCFSEGCLLWVWWTLENAGVWLWVMWEKPNLQRS